jgi:CheY-like chemotaxis protein
MMGQRGDMRQVALIVEDDPDVRELAAAILEEADLRVVETSSAEEALAHLRHHAGEVAFVFADVRLPCPMSGVDLARSVRLKWPWIRTIVTSGSPLDLDDLTKLPREVRFLPKPWRALDVLIEAERAVIGAPERQANSPA